MAESVLDIKRHIKSIEGTEHITKAMKLVSAAKFKKAKDKFDSSSVHLGNIRGAIEEIVMDGGEFPEKYFKTEEQMKHTCYVVVSGNKGLCGAFNANLLKFADEFIKEHTAQLNTTPHILAVGSKADNFFTARGVAITEKYDFNIEGITFPHIKMICGPMFELFSRGEVDEVYVIYTKFINSLNLQPVAVKIFPIMEPIKTDNYNYEFEFSDSPETEKAAKEKMLDYLVPKYLEMSLYKAVIESSASEHIARRNAMDTATDNAGEMLKALNLRYNRARQAGITNELIEIVSGAEALK